LRAPARSLFIAVFLGLIFCSSIQAQNRPASRPRHLRRARPENLRCSGLSIAIVKDGKTILAKGYGVRKLGAPTSVDENTLFGIGSNTKAFTTAALASLADAHKISWDDPVYQRLPGFQMYDPYVSHEMTIRDLLTHRSGMGLAKAISSSGLTPPSRAKTSSIAYAS